MLDITVVIATHPGRERLLRRALASVCMQSLQPAAIIVERDTSAAGSAVTRNRALAKVTTEWVAFLDSDDQFLAQHLERLAGCAESTNADVVYSIPEFVGRSPVQLRFGLPFSAEALRQDNFIPVTVLARTGLVRRVGGFQLPDDGSPFDDYGCWLKMVDLGARFVHLPERTWVWHWHDAQTQGLAQSRVTAGCQA